MTPNEFWHEVFGEIEPGAFWAKASGEGCSQADEAVDLDLAARGIWLEIPDREILSRYLCACVPGVPHDWQEGEAGTTRLPGW